MRHSANAHHKLFIASTLLILFALPFAIQWRSTMAFDSKAVMAGGAVVGTSAFSGPTVKTTPDTNYAGQIDSIAGTTFTGLLAQ